MAPPVVDESQLGHLIEQYGYKYVDGSGYGPGALWVRGSWGGNNGDVFTPNTDPKTGGGTFTQESIANAILPTSSPYLKEAAAAVDRSGQVGIDPSGVPRYFTYGRNGETVWGAQAPPMNMMPGHSTSSSTNISQSFQDPAALALQGRQLDFQIADAQAKLKQAQQAQDWQQVYQQQQLLQQATLQRESLAQQAQLAVQSQQSQAALQQSAQGFTALQNQNAQTNSNQQAATGRAFTSNNDANARALSAAEFAAQQEAQQQGFQFQVDQANVQGQRQAGQDRLAAADQYAKLVSSTDTAALPAYLAAGGGTLFNARANPNAPSLLTDNAINPAASSLRDARTIAWQPIAAKPIQGFQQPAYQQWQEPAYGQAAQTVGAAVQQPQQQQGTSSIGTALLNPNPSQSGPLAAGGMAPNENAQGNLVAPGGQAPQWAPTPGFASGTPGFVPAPQQGFYTSERGPEFMQVVDPPGPHNAQIRVVPNGQGQGMSGFAALHAQMHGMHPGYADGTAADPTGMGIDQSGLDPYAAEVRQFRTNFQGPQYGFSQFDPRFSRRLSTGMQNAYFNGQQTQSGVPAEALAHEADFYTPIGYKSAPYRVTPQLDY